MNNAAPFDQMLPVEPSHLGGSVTHAVNRNARPASCGSHEQLMHAAVVAALRAAATAADLRRTLDANRLAQATADAQG